MVYSLQREYKIYSLRNFVELSKPHPNLLLFSNPNTPNRVFQERTVSLWGNADSITAKGFVKRTLSKENELDVILAHISENTGPDL